MIPLSEGIGREIFSESQFIFGRREVRAKVHNRKMSENIIIDIIGPGIGLVSSIGCLVVLNTYLKELHAELKKLLNVLYANNAIALGISCTVSGWSDDYYCLGRVLTLLPPYTLTIVNLPILSYMRYYITMKTQKSEAIDKAWLQKILTLTYLGKFYLK